MAWSDAAREAALAARRAHEHPNTHHVMRSRRGRHTSEIKPGSKDDRLRNMTTPTVLGYELNRQSLTPVRTFLDTKT